MEKRIELEKRARRPNQIVELNLDNCRSTNIVGLTDEYTALESLSLINVGLTTLKGFPKLPNLKKLELSDNRISNGLNYLTTSPKLQYLNLSGNKIKDLEALKPLQTFKNLAILDLFNNEATLIGSYRDKIFEMLPTLKFLDGFDCNDVEAPSDADDDEEVNGNDSEDDISDEGCDDDDDDDEENGDDTDSDDLENGDVSLAEVYNNDLEDDNSEWDEEDGGEDEDEEDTDEDDGGEEAPAATCEKTDPEVGEEQEARGKKRKHDG